MQEPLILGKGIRSNVPSAHRPIVVFRLFLRRTSNARFGNAPGVSKSGEAEIPSTDTGGEDPCDCLGRKSAVGRRDRLRSDFDHVLPPASGGPNADQTPKLRGTSKAFHGLFKNQPCRVVET